MKRASDLRKCSARVVDCRWPNRGSAELLADCLRTAGPANRTDAQPFRLPSARPSTVTSIQLGITWEVRQGENVETILARCGDRLVGEPLLESLRTTI